MKKKMLSVLLAGLCVCSLAACGSTSTTEETTTGTETETTVESDTLIMATSADFPPYEYYEGDEIVGLDVEMAQAIAEELGLKLQIEDMAFDSIIAAVDSGKADFGASGMTVTEERKQQVDFSDTYYTARQVIIVADTNTEITGSDSLEGKKIGVQTGTTGDLYVTDDYGEENVERFTNGAEATLALSQGKVDAVVIDDQPAKSYVNTTAGLKILESEYVEEEYALCFQKGSGLVKSVNEAIQTLKDNGKFDEIAAKYIQ